MIKTIERSFDPIVVEQLSRRKRFHTIFHPNKNRPPLECFRSEYFFGMLAMISFPSKNLLLK